MELAIRTSVILASALTQCLATRADFNFYCVEFALNYRLLVARQLIQRRCRLVLHVCGPIERYGLSHLVRPPVAVVNGTAVDLVVSLAWSEVFLVNDESGNRWKPILSEPHREAFKPLLCKTAAPVEPVSL